MGIINYFVHDVLEFHVFDEKNTLLFHFSSSPEKVCAPNADGEK